MSLTNMLNIRKKKKLFFEFEDTEFKSIMILLKIPEFTSIFEIRAMEENHHLASKHLLL